MNTTMENMCDYISEAQSKEKHSEAQSKEKHFKMFSVFL